MEDQRFDELAKRLARPVSRRQLVKVLVATTVGGIFARSGAGKALAGTSGTCTPNSACAHFCTAIFGGDTSDQSACASEATKCQGLCFACGPGANPGGLTPCPGGSLPGHCANLQTDNNNCGACNHACSSGQFCCGGKCIAACVASDQCHVSICDPAAQACANTPKTDGTACTGTDRCFQTYSCQAGVCTGSSPVVCTALDQCHLAGTCDPTTGQCSNPIQSNGTACNANMCTTGDTCQSGVCTSNRVSACSSGQCCSGGVCQTGGTASCPCCDPSTNTCVTTCPAGSPNCCGGCTDVQTDSSNCGTCGNVCPLGCCGGKCTNVLTDSNNCGNCGTVCPAGSPNCCDGGCTDVQTDSFNCGTCDNVCPLGCCGGVCKNLGTDPNNCGNCGTVCSSGLCCFGTCCSSGQCCDSNVENCVNSCTPPKICVSGFCT